MEHPAFTLSGLCLVGGIMGYVRKGSLPSMLGGVGVGLVYGAAGYLLKENMDYGIHLALGASSVLLAAGSARAAATRFRKPVPLLLFGIGGLSTVYYCIKYNQFYGSGL
ncbi:hypothetical protein BABINDRAFT_166265 [Babjeviella inositovora NRRL Y-12698]|uniref:Uncharacterized protein n=1 Tax=Babjeviella inositovora NRRL Y-12698 TaxID=984486 RepID=A0A1E3QSI2_9ASCO|nr:uncharacterized protein BABINDRAFT_166265 [Babjeviella inositovora NRRL Y-12698]ODQ80663.1 hypothetical protein BABINDRAFT_166265 [Babjeviella inositovora NRRL Y-12698]